MVQVSRKSVGILSSFAMRRLAMHETGQNGRVNPFVFFSIITFVIFLLLRLWYILAVKLKSYTDAKNAETAHIQFVGCLKRQWSDEFTFVPAVTAVTKKWSFFPPKLLYLGTTYATTVTKSSWKSGKNVVTLKFIFSIMEIRLYIYLSVPLIFISQIKTLFLLLKNDQRYHHSWR